MVMSWVKESMRRDSGHPLPWDIVVFLRGCMLIVIRFVYWDANSVID